MKVKTGFLFHSSQNIIFLLPRRCKYKTHAKAVGISLNVRGFFAYYVAPKLEAISFWAFLKATRVSIA